MISSDNMSAGVWRGLRRTSLGTVLMLSLVACGSESDTRLATVGRALSDLVSGEAGRSAPPTAQQLGASLTPEALAQVGQPVMVVSLERQNAASLMAQVMTTGVDTNWRDSGNNQLTFTPNGVLRATRGLGGDLMAADVGQTADLLRRGGSGSASRTHVYVDGDLQSTPISASCSLGSGETVSGVIGGRTQTVRRVTESCTYEDGAFENVFWVARNGQIVKSLQWAGPRIGRIGTELFIP